MVTSCAAEVEKKSERREIDAVGMLWELLEKRCRGCWGRLSGPLRTYIEKGGGIFLSVFLFVSLF